MGRRPKNKTRPENPEIRRKWIGILMPYFSANGFSHLTMDKLAKIIGVSKATFYKHFASKEQLMEEILALKIARIGEHKKILADSSIPYEDRFLKTLEHAADSLTDLSNKFLNDLKEEFPEKYRLLDEFKNQNLNFLKEFYSQARRDGYFEPEFSPEAMIIVDNLVFSGANDPEVLRRHNLTLRDFYIQYLAIKLGGIMPAHRYHAFKGKLEELVRKIESKSDFLSLT